jgi:6-phosphogluconolactonase
VGEIDGSSFSSTMGLYLYATLREDNELAWYSVDLSDGSLELQGTVPLPGHGAGIGADPSRTTLFVATHDTAQLCSFRLDPTTGAPSLLNVLDTGLEDPAYIATDLSGRFLITPFYASGCVATYPIDRSDGAARGTAISHIDTGKHAHGVAIAPTNTHVFIPHAGGTYPHYPAGLRGANCIYQFSLSSDGVLLPNQDAATVNVTGHAGDAAAEVGPRHLLFRPDNRFVYSSNEQDNSVTMYTYRSVGRFQLSKLTTNCSLPIQYDSFFFSKRLTGPCSASTGSLTPQQTVSSLPVDYTEGGAAARLQLHPSGKWVLCANRGHQSLAVFAIDEVTGRLEFKGCTKVDATPRAFAFDSSGRFCYSAGERTDTIKCFSFDQSSGEMKLLHTYGTGRHPWWVEVVEVGQSAVQYTGSL